MGEGLLKLHRRENYLEECGWRSKPLHHWAVSGRCGWTLLCECIDEDPIQSLLLFLNALAPPTTIWAELHTTGVGIEGRSVWNLWWESSDYPYLLLLWGRSADPTLWRVSRSGVITPVLIKMVMSVPFRLVGPQHLIFLCVLSPHWLLLFSLSFSPSF